MQNLIVSAIVLGMTAAPFSSGFQTSSTQGFWAPICGSGSPVWIDLSSKDSERENTPLHSKACHAICCKREDGQNIDADKSES
ncbi:hypothetical protein ACJ3XI_10545 [Litorimonas sp. RW-G-Af-16]|uniref:hypothetical protein n=1 Tax=Litorimonas sp. RW-G-Af-16 TaxID=3241168 RepID=UPI00390CA9F5